jgi:hypothetical protein
VAKKENKMDRNLWKRFGFKIALAVVDVIEDELVPNTENSWDDAAVSVVKTTLITLQAKFVTE